jgi:hypothetical protein
MFAVTSPNNASSGTYGATVTASDSTISVHTASKNASYVIPSVGDTQPPTTPTGLTGSGKRRRVSLTWTAATDNVGVVKYEIWRDGVRLADATTTSYIDSAVSLGSSHIYSVVAYDAAGNASSPSNPVKVTVRNK